MFTKLAIAAAIATQPAFGIETNTVDTNTLLIDVENTIGDTCIKDFNTNPTADLFPTKWSSPSIKTYGDVDLYGAKFEPSVTTELLDITYHNNYKIIHNKFVNATYLLYQCGTEPPVEEVESGNHKLILEVPHKGGLLLTSTVQIPAIELLGLRNEVKAYVGNTKWISSPCLNHMLDEGEIINVDGDRDDVGHSESASSVEAFLAAYPDALVLGGPYDNPDAANTMVIAGSQENTNVGQFDWIAFYAALYNKEDMSNRIAGSAQQNYDCASENSYFLSTSPIQRKLKATTSTTRRVAEGEEDGRPTLLWASWFSGYGWSVASCPTYQSDTECEWAAACNVKILSRPEGVGNAPESLGGRYWYLSDEEFLEFGKDADRWVYKSQHWLKVFEEKGEEYFQQFKAYRNQQVYDTQGVSPNSWYEQRLAEYYVVGMDVCAIMGVDDGLHKSRWLRNIFSDPIGVMPECNVAEIDEPYVAPVSDCMPIAATLNVVSEGEGEVNVKDNAGAVSAVQGLTLIASLAVVASLW